jgi:TetR/AcrR family transcriptional repressor of nem operon
MADKGLKTRENITAQALQLFSVKGYFNTSVSDILSATGLTKGGLYCHFRSKEDIWYAVYDKAVVIWKETVYAGLQDIGDPLLRIERMLDNVLMRYLGEDVFQGGCFFVNMLVELSGQSAAMSRHILRGFVGFSRHIARWLKEADARGLLKPALNFQEISNFIVITLNGAATLYMSIRQGEVLHQTISQLKFYIEQLKA